MKNKNILKIVITIVIVLGVLVGGFFGIRACNMSKRENKGHTHSYTYEMIKNPTIDAAGKIKGTCECGEAVEKDVPSLSDNTFWSVKSTTVTCTSDGDTIYQSIYGELPNHEVALSHHYSNLIEAREVSCLNDGYPEHYECLNCGVWFDENLNEINQFDVITPKIEHAMVHHLFLRATPVDDGNIEYYHCSLCDKNYSDKLGLSEITTSVIIPAGFGSTEGMQTMSNLTYPDFPETPMEKNSWEYIEDEDITIKWYVDVSSWVQPTGEDQISKYIYEKTGIKVKFETPVADDGTKLATMIAGGELPDVISLPTSQSLQIEKLASQGYVYDINTLAEKWAPSLYYNLPRDVWNWWELGDGFTYGIPNHYYSYQDIKEPQLQPNGGMMVREDLFNEWQQYCYTNLADSDGLVHYTSLSGIEKTVPWQGYITTPEGFKEAAKYELSLHKGSSAGDISTGLLLSQFNTNGCTSLIWLSQFFAIPFEDAEGNYVYTFTTESYKNMLLYLNDLYNEGIITKANFTYDYNGIGGVVASGGAFATLVTPQDYQMHFVTANKGNCGYVSMYITNEEGDAPVLADIRGYGYLMNMITTKCSRPDLVIKLFDYLTSVEGQLLVTLGVEGVTWNYTDETKTEVAFTEQYLEDKANSVATKYGLMQFDVLINYQLYDNMQPKTNNGKTADELLRTNLKRPLTIYAYDYNATHFVIDTSNPDYNDYSTNRLKIESLIAKQLPKIIQATSKAKAEEVYNTTVSTMYEYGLELITRLNSEAYLKTKEKLGITIAWPPYMEGYNVEPDRLHPNGDTSYYRSY